MGITHIAFSQIAFECRDFFFTSSQETRTCASSKWLKRVFPLLQITTNQYVSTTSCNYAHVRLPLSTVIRCSNMCHDIFLMLLKSIQPATVCSRDTTPSTTCPSLKLPKAGRNPHCCQVYADEIMNVVITLMFHPSKPVSHMTNYLSADLCTVVDSL